MAHHSQNRIESYHQLRAAIASVNGKKQLAGRNDIAIEVSNQCGRLIANAIIYYNSALLSKLLARHEARGDVKSVNRLKKYSPVAWEYLHFLGHYTFGGKKSGINLDEMIDSLVI